jgi:hypothetical protein
VSPAVAAALFALITELVKDSPEILKEFEALLGKASGAPVTPIAPVVSSDTAAVLASLKAAAPQ